MSNLAYVTILVESNNEDISQCESVELTQKAYNEHILELKKYDF